MYWNQRIAAPLAAMVIFLGACDEGGLSSKRMKPNDFARTDQETAAAQNQELAASPQRVAPPTGASAEASPPAPVDAPVSPEVVRAALPPTAPADATPSLLARPELTVDAMVGHINGKAVYAGEVFREIGEDELTRLGNTLPRLAFRDQSLRLVDDTLRGRVVNSLILAEAEGGLSEREQLGLLAFLKQEREKVLAEYGSGVAAVADAELIKKRGYGVEEELERRRQKLLVEKFLNEKLLPHTFVNRREVERYYQDHFREFNPTPSVTVRVIIARDLEAADRVDAALAKGESFEVVAKQFSAFRPEQGGLLPSFNLKGPLAEFNELSWKQLNEKVRKLEVGGYCDRTDLDGSFGWAKLEGVEGREARSLQEASLEIEQKIRGTKFSTRQQKYIADLFQKGNFTPLEKMRDEIMKVTMTRYARAQ